MVVTFYSFKGGVGRSMALANVAELLAGFGYRLVACDWDLEAPGLERYFVPNNATGDEYRRRMDAFLDRPGLVDLLVDYKETLSRPQEAAAASTLHTDTHAQLGEVWLRRPASYAAPVDELRTTPGSLRLLTAGRRLGPSQRRYGDAVRRFDWQQFYEEWAGDAYVDFFRRDLTGEPAKGVEGAADLLLIDSRTGVTEQGGVCTHHLADLVLVLTAANDLNMEGARWMVQALADPQLTKARGGRPLGVLPIASRIEQTAQTKELVDFRRQFVSEFRTTLGQWVSDPEAFAIATEIPYMPYYSYHERVVAREAEAVFNEDWEVMAIHHASKESREERWSAAGGAIGVGEGVWIGAIARELGRALEQAQPKATRGPRAAPPRRARLFVSYAYPDEALWTELSKHLAVLVRRGNVETWTDRSIKPGQHWQAQIDAALAGADIVLLLLSADYLASDFLVSELDRVLDRHEAGQVRVLPIILRPFMWPINDRLARLEALPKGGTPVTAWSNRDAAWTSVLQGIKAAVDSLAARSMADGDERR